MIYKSILFDLDGTLIQSTPELRYKLVQSTLVDLGASTALDHHVDRWWFESDRDRTIKENFHVDPKAFWRALQRYNTVEFCKQHIRAYDDVSMVREIRERGYKTGIVTDSPRKLVQYKISLICEELFDVIIVCQSINHVRHKPNPDGLQKAMFLLGVQPAEARYVGNADVDVMAANNAGVLDVLIDRGEYNFPNVRPSHAIKSLYELDGLLNAQVCAIKRRS